MKQSISNSFSIKSGFYKGLLICLLTTLGTELQAQGHYIGSSFNPNDYFIPPVSGWVFSLYYAHSQMDYYNEFGQNSDRIPIHQDPPVDAVIGQNVQTNSIIPMALYFGKGKLFNARWGMMGIPVISNPNTNIVLDFYLGQEQAANQKFDITSFGLADIYFQPLWLNWEKDDMSLAFSYGIWMPTGSYKVDSPKNVGLGYWSHDIRMAGRYKLHPQITITTAATYEINSKQKDVSYTEADHITIDYGSAYTFTMGHEVGVYGHASWQVGHDKGLKGNPNGDRIFGLGMYGSYWLKPGKFGMLARVVNNFEERSRFGGFSFQVGFNYLLFKG